MPWVHRDAAATTERHVFVLDAGGQMLWQAAAPDDIQSLICAPVGTGVLCGLQSGRILCMEWQRE